MKMQNQSLIPKDLQQQAQEILELCNEVQTKIEKEKQEEAQ